MVDSRLRLEPYFAEPDRQSKVLVLLAEDAMTRREIQDAIGFLERMFVGVGEQDRLFEVIAALKEELARRNKR